MQCYTLTLMTLVLTQSACGAGANKSTIGEPCSTNQDCKPGLVCIDGECRLACANDSACGGAEPVCDGGGCRPLAAGESCVTDAECTALPGDPECIVAKCLGHKCDYSVLTTRLCASLRCEDGFVYFERTCNDKGICATPTPAGLSCQGFACATATACKQSCSSANDCVGHSSCLQGGICQLPQPDGASCAVNGDCIHGACVESVEGGKVCCERPCDGVCEACGDDGRCNRTPVSGDDSRCGVIACSTLDNHSGCRAYADLTSSRCAGPGLCKTASGEHCSFTSLPASTGCGACHMCDGAGKCGASPCCDASDQPFTEGTACGQCRACSADGQCNVTPNSDPSCGSDFGCDSSACVALGVCSPGAAAGTKCGLCQACDGRDTCSATPAADDACPGDGTACQPKTCSDFGACLGNAPDTTQCGTGDAFFCKVDECMQHKCINFCSGGICEDCSADDCGACGLNPPIPYL